MTIRIGLVGAGLWTERAHLPAFTHLPDVTIAGIADPDLERARALASRFGVARAVSDHRALLDLGVDALSIVAPDDVHHEVAAAALDRASPSCARSRWRERCRKPPISWPGPRPPGSPTKLGFVFRYSPALRQLRALVQDGYVGRVHSLDGLQPEPPVHGPGRAVPLEDGRGPDGRRRRRRVRLAQPGPRPVDRRRDQEVCANARTVVPERPDPLGGGRRRVDVDDVCSWLGTQEGGVESMFHSSWASIGQPWGDLAVFG